MKLPEKNITQWYAHEIADAVNKSLIEPSEIANSFNQGRQIRIENC